MKPLTTLLVVLTFATTAVAAGTLSEEQARRSHADLHRHCPPSPVVGVSHPPPHGSAPAPHDRTRAADLRSAASDLHPEAIGGRMRSIHLGAGRPSARPRRMIVASCESRDGGLFGGGRAG